MIYFYDIDEDYVNFLRKFDKQVPHITYNSNNKFVCGIVLDVNGIQYYAPISHMTNLQRTNLQIFQHNQPIATIRFSFMIPAFDAVLTKKDFNTIKLTDANYANLLSVEFQYCKSHIQEIRKKAFQVYKIGCNKNHSLNYACCDFKKLEQYYMEYNVV